MDGTDKSSRHSILKILARTSIKTEISNQEYTVERQLGGLERQFYQQNLIGSTHMCGILRFDGHYDGERLRQSIRKLSEAYPLLRASIVADPYLRFSMKGAPERIPLEVTERQDDEQWRRVVEENLIRPFHPGEGLAAFRILRSTDAFDIIFTVNHAVADGITAGMVCRNLIKFYNDEALVPLALQKPMEDRFPRLFKGIIGWFLALKFVFTLAKLGPALQIGSANATQNTLSQGITFNRSTELIALARARGCNLFGLVSAVILQSIYELYGKNPIEALSLNTPVSLRAAIGADIEEFGVFLSGHLALYSVGKDTDTWTLAKQCFDTVNQGIREGRPFLLAKLARAARKPKKPKVSSRMSSHRPTVNISNMGRVQPFPKMGDAVVTEHRAAAAQSVKDPFAFVLVTYKELLFIDLQTSLEKLGRDDGHRILATVQKNLGKLLPA